MLAALILANAVTDGAVLIASLAKVAVRHVFVGRDRRTFDHDIRDRDFQAIRRSVRHDLGEDLAMTLNDARDDSLVGVAVLARPGFHDAADHRFVSFDVARQGRVAVHQTEVLADFMAHAPSRFVVHGQLALQFLGRNAVPGRGKQVHGVEPFLQWNMGFLERRSHHRVNVVATLAGIGRHFRQLLELASLEAARAFVSLAEALFEQVLKAGVIVREKLHKFGDRHGLRHGAVSVSDRIYSRDGYIRQVVNRQIGCMRDTRRSTSNKERMAEAVMSVEPVAWGSFTWRSGADTYRFDIQDQGLIGRLSFANGRNFSLPMVVWEALFDTIKTNRKAKAKADTNLPPRAGARWTDSESDELAAKYRSGRSIDDLAREHARTEWAIETQLSKIGLWDRIERRRIA